MSLLTEVLAVGGVAMDLVGAGVLSHTHNAESIAEIRAEAGAEKRSLGEDDAIATHAQLLAEKRIGFFILTVGITIHLVGLVIKSPEDAAPMGLLALGVIAVGLIFTVIWTKVVGGKVRRQAREAAKNGGGATSPSTDPLRGGRRRPDITAVARLREAGGGGRFRSLGRLGEEEYAWSATR